MLDKNPESRVIVPQMKVNVDKIVVIIAAIILLIFHKSFTDTVNRHPPLVNLEFKDVMILGFQVSCNKQDWFRVGLALLGSSE